MSLPSKLCQAVGSLAHRGNYQNESGVGDVLLFRTDAESTCTQVYSPYSDRIYYTILVDGLETSIYTGNTKGTTFNLSMHVATVSAATSGTRRFQDAFWSFTGMMSAMGATLGGQGSLARQETEKQEDTAHFGGDGHPVEAKGEMSEKHPDFPSSKLDAAGKSTVSDRRLIPTKEPGEGTDGLLFIRLGKDAFAGIGDCLKVEKSS